MNIPPMQMHPKYRVRFRYVFEDEVQSYHFSPRDVCHALAYSDTPTIGETLLYPVLGAIRIHTIEMWAPAQSADLATPTTVALSMYRTLTDGSAASSFLNAAVQDTSVNPTVPAHCTLTMAKANQLRQWYENLDATFLFTAAGPKGTILEIDVEGFVNLQVATTPTYSTTTLPPGALCNIGLSKIDFGNPAGSRVVAPIRAPGNFAYVIFG
jgi:hypothetical protein